MKTIKVDTLSKWAAIVLLSLSTAWPAPLAAQDADAKEEREKAKIQREEEREKVLQEREAERVYQQARKLAGKDQWEEALKAFDEASQRGGSRAGNCKRLWRGGRIFQKLWLLSRHSEAKAGRSLRSNEEIGAGTWRCTWGENWGE